MYKKASRFQQRTRIAAPGLTEWKLEEGANRVFAELAAGEEKRRKKKLRARGIENHSAHAPHINATSGTSGPSLTVRCLTCQNESEVPEAIIREKFSNATQIAEIRNGFRCGLCGSGTVALRK